MPRPRANGGRQSGSLCALLVAAVGAAASLQLFGRAFAGALPGLSRRHLSRTALSAVGEITGLTRNNGTWDLPMTIAVETEADMAAADKAWAIFKEKYKKASESGIFIDTPVAEDDVKYRFMRLKEFMKLTPDKAVELMSVDCMPLVVDSDFTQSTFDAMVRGSSYDDAVEVVFKNPPVLTASDAIESAMDQAKMAAAFMEFSRPLNNVIQSVLGSGGR